MEWHIKIWHCTKCHHEWEHAAVFVTSTCDQCKAPGYVLHEYKQTIDIEKTINKLRNAK